MIASAPATAPAGFAQALAALAFGGTALLLAFLSLTRPAARLARWPVASALLGGGWIAMACGVLLGPLALGLLQRESLVELRPLVQLGLAWVGLLVGLQMRGALLQAVPSALWRWTALDAVVSALLAGAATLACMHRMAPDVGAGALWTVVSLMAAASIGWSGEVRSLHGLDTRASQVVALIQAGAGLGSALAIIASDMVSLSPDASRMLLATLAVAAAAALSLRAALGRQSGDDGRLTLALLGTLALIAGAAATAGASPLPGAFLLGMVVANLRGGSLRRMERLVAESEPAVAAVFFLLAGVMLQGGLGWWPWLLAAAITALRLTLKPLAAALALGHRWSEPGASRLRAAPIRQAPIAIVLAVASLQAHDTPTLRAALLALAVAGVACGVLPLLWRRRA